jgi:radical SAM protein with 4Fe4S-binding SPASM domain
MRVDIATNGFHIPKRVLFALRTLPIFQVQVSIDGIEAAHDKLRGRAGAFAASCQTLRRLKAEGIATSISTTVTRDNIDMLDEILELAMSLGCSGYKAIPFMASGRGRDNAAALALTPEQHLRMCRWIAHNAERLSGTIAISTDTTFTFLLNGVPSPCAGDGHVGCAAGHDTLCIAADGTVYPCPFLRDFPLGRMPGMQLREIWHEAPILQRLRILQKSDLAAPCNQCPAAPGTCGGGCRAAAYFASGDLCGVDPNCFLAAGMRC